MQNGLQYKTDAASVDEALVFLLENLKGVKAGDLHVINDAVWHACAQLDVDQDALENALPSTAIIFSRYNKHTSPNHN